MKRYLVWQIVKVKDDEYPSQNCIISLAKDLNLWEAAEQEHKE